MVGSKWDYLTGGGKKASSSSSGYGGPFGLSAIKRLG